jgi:hypothetical protein
MRIVYRRVLMSALNQKHREKENTIKNNLKTNKHIRL